MTVSNVTLGVSADLRSGPARFFLPGASDFSSTLTLGQIIKGKVMRQYEGNRYLVEFGGHERVVDSSIPLTTGELIHGRVVGLGDRVELQRVPPPGDGDTKTISTDAAVDELRAPAARGQQLIEDFAAQYRADLSNADKSVLARASRAAADPSAMALVGVMVNKLGLSQSPELLWSVYRALLREDAASAGLYAARDMAKLETVPDGAASLQAAAVRQIADTLFKQLDPSAERKDDKNVSLGAPNVSADTPTPTPISLAAPPPVRGDTEEGRGDSRRLAHRLLNVQTEGTVAHRIGTVPLLLGNRLIEVDLAFFEQRKDSSAAVTANPHRKIVFALKTEHLGNVEISANLSGSHVRLQIVTDDQDATGEASAHAQELRSALAAGNWEVDEISYETKQTDSRNGVVRSVVEHVVSQDSLNRLI